MKILALQSDVKYCDMNEEKLGSDRNALYLLHFAFPLMGTLWWPRLPVLLALAAKGTSADCTAHGASLLQLGNLPPHGPCLNVQGFSCGSERAEVGSGSLVEVAPQTCPLCPKSGSASAVLYGIERSDGLGERVYQLLTYFSTAALYNMTFGGFLFNQSLDGGHKMNASVLVDSLSTYIGSNYSSLRVSAERPAFDHCWRCLEDPSTPPPAARPGQSILAWLGCKPMPETSVFGPLNAGFLKAVRQSSQLLSRPVPHFSSGATLRVAVHLRRGDIMKTTLGHGVNRFIPDSFYLKFLRLLKPLVAPAKIHVFSATEGLFTDADFDDYRQLGAQVHLDGEAVEDWAHMAQADVLVVAPSGFSWVAGILNSKCVLGFESYPYAYHPNWIKLNQHFSNLEELRSCLLKLNLS